MEYVIIFFVGLLVGGVINALADYLPYEPRQKPLHYQDGTPRSISAWLGLSAFLLGKRNATSDTPSLSWRYPLIEILTGTLFVITLIASQNMSFMTLPQLLMYWVYVAILVLILVIDVEHRLILFVVVIPSIGLALIDALILPPITLIDSLAGAGFGFGIFFLLYLGGYVFTYVMGQLRGEKITTVAFGYGDVMLITFSGALLGVAYTAIAMFITVFLGAIGAFAYLAMRLALKGRYNLFTAIPYGPYIIIATLIMLLYGRDVWFYVFGWYPS
jgi:leader peptidase (prepilin peptidase) / N-methyltransferase